MKLSEIKVNKSNPRIIKDEKFKKLIKSLEDFPKMMEFRPIVVNDDGMILGGNMRYRALLDLGYKEVPDNWVKKASDLTDDEKRRFIIVDNLSFGEHDWDALANEWDSEQLEGWGLDVPYAKDDKIPPKTDLTEKHQLYRKNNFNYLSLFKKSKEGVELKKLKEPEYFDRIAYVFYSFVIQNIKNKKTCLVCPPPRRHIDWNLAQQLTKYIGEKSGCNFELDLFKANSLQKINPDIELKKELVYDNYVIIDDIITTGSTVSKIVELLENKNVMVFIAINNN